MSSLDLCGEGLGWVRARGGWDGMVQIRVMVFYDGILGGGWMVGCLMGDGVG